LEPISEASASLLSPSDISFDKTEEDLDVSYLRGGKKWKRSTSVQPPGTVDEEEEFDITPPGKRSRRTHVCLGFLLSSEIFQQSIYSTEYCQFSTSFQADRFALKAF
jgi:hypothetical protein